MSDSLAFCTVCGRVKYAKHKCPPQWEGWVEDIDTEESAICAYEYEERDAAATILEKKDYEWGEGPTNEAVVRIRKVGDTKWLRYTVRSGTEVIYHAEPFKE